MEIYLDNSATTRPSPEVRRTLMQAMDTEWYNPSSLYRPSMEVQKKQESIRALCLHAAGADGQSLVFTGSGTEADNLAILGRMARLRGGGRVLFSCVEHPAVLMCRQELEKAGWAVETVAVTPDGRVDLQKLEEQLSSDVRLLVIMQVNNETGAVQPLEEITRLRDRLSPECSIHVDGVQGFLRCPVAFNRLRIQSYALSGHKIHALKGIGALIFRKDHALSPCVWGGGQEYGLRSGTENTPGILSLGTAVASFPKDAPERMRAMKVRLWEQIRARIPRAVVNGPEPSGPVSAPHILNVSLPPVRSQTMLFALEGEGIYVSAGSACSSHRQKLSPVLSAMGIRGERADCAIRFSFCPDNRMEDMDTVAEVIARQYAVLGQYTRR